VLGYHDGGARTCTLTSSCTAGFSLRPSGACAPLDPCPAGAHDGGDGGCVAPGLCSPSFTPAPGGGCYRFRRLLTATSSRAGGSATLLFGGELLLAGGADANGAPVPGSERLSIDADRTTADAGFVRPRIAHEALLLPGGAVVASGGYSGTSLLRVAERWDGARASWTAGASAMPVPRYALASILLRDGRPLFFSGQGDENGDGAHLACTGSTLVYDAASDVWTALGAMGVPRCTVPRPVLLPDGRVFISGGLDQPPCPDPTKCSRRVPLSSSVELFDPRSGSWAFGAPPSLQRQGHTQTALADGRVLVAGGRAADETSLSSAEIYDPARDVWTAAAPMHQDRAHHGAALLRDGRVLVAGGASIPDPASLEPLSSAEIYDPTADAWDLLPVGLAATRLAMNVVPLEDGRPVFLNGIHDCCLAARVSAEVFEYGR
jgi:hypothetical protein